MQLTADTLERVKTGAPLRAAAQIAGSAAQFAPEAPTSLSQCGFDPEVLENLALKLAYAVPRFSTDWAARRLCLPLQLTAEILDKLRDERLVEVLGQAGPFSFQFAVTERGRERAARLLEISGYVGPAPVSLEDYTRELERQFSALPEPDFARIAAALSELVLPQQTVEIAALAMVARRSLFLYGPPGNGKTTIGHLLRDAMVGDLWIPHAIVVDHDVIRLFDATCHEVVEEDPVDAAGMDRRWVRIRPPFIVVGGELTLDALDLVYTPSLGYYQAPLHVKANGGIFLLDDFGCQRATPEQLLNRWIHPLERKVDFLTLRSGQQIKVPFRQMLAVATNLDPQRVMTPAFLRRMGYRLHLEGPSPQEYAQIFTRQAQQAGVQAPPGAIEMLLDRYRTEERPLRACEPRDLIERAQDLCRLRAKPFELSIGVLDVAWRGYFGNR